MCVKRSGSWLASSTDLRAAVAVGSQAVSGAFVGPVSVPRGFGPVPRRWRQLFPRGLRFLGRTSLRGTVSGLLCAAAPPLARTFTAARGVPAFRCSRSSGRVLWGDEDRPREGLPSTRPCKLLRSQGSSVDASLLSSSSSSSIDSSVAIIVHQRAILRFSTCCVALRRAEFSLSCPSSPHCDRIP